MWARWRRSSCNAEEHCLDVLENVMRQSDEVISELQGIADGLARGQNANANVADGCNRGRNHSSAVFHVADNAGVNPDDALYAVLLDAGAAAEGAAGGLDVCCV